MTRSIEQYRDVVIDGAMAQAFDVCKRLLRTESSSIQRVETAQLVLERLRSGSIDDSSDDVNMLLRLLGNYVEPTRKLTEEILSLLLFCNHRVLLVHHLPKLTYQSKECVKLVVRAYLDLLMTDRSLLVPVLGSLAEMPLDTSEKNTIVEATLSLLEAAEEQDLPAVVQSLLSMVTKSSALKALGRLRSECNCIQSGTLSLIVEVIGRYATIGSVALTALLRLIRHVDPLTTFDIILLTLVMGKSAENELAVRTTTFIAQSGSVHGRMMAEAAAMLVRTEWAYLLPSFIRFCSCLLAACFRASTRAVLAPNLIASSIDSMIVLIETRSKVQEEALILLLTIVSHPKRLLLLANTDSAQQIQSALCWNVAEAIALRLSELAQRNAGALASSSHLFLDHLHGITSFMTDSEADGQFPSHILDLLCSTMALLTKKERGIYSLLMITIQKQLVTRVGASGLTRDQQSFRFQSGRSLQTCASAVEVKQLMAVFLTGHLLKNQVVVESRDQKSLANWMLRLLTLANHDETLLHVLRFVRDEMNRSRETSVLEKERALLTAAVSQVFHKRGLCWTPRNHVQTNEDSRVIIAFDDVDNAVATDSDGLTTPLAVDATEFVLKMRFGVPPSAFGSMNHSEREAQTKLTERKYLMKICLLRELFHCYLDFASPIEQSEIVSAAFLLPSAYLRPTSGEPCGPLEFSAQNNLIWNLVCALEVAVASTNFAAEQYSSMLAISKPRHDCLKQYSRMAARLHVCFEQQDQLVRILATQKKNILARRDGLNNISSFQRAGAQSCDPEWLLLEALIVEQLLNGQLRRVQGEPPRASLFGLDFRVVCLAFEGQQKNFLEPPLLLPNELKLLQVFYRHLQSGGIPCSASSGDSESDRNLRRLVSKSEGRRAVKWLCRRATELSHMISIEEFDPLQSAVDGDFEADLTLDQSTSTTRKKLMAYSLAYIYDSFIVILEECRIAKTTGDSCWSDKMMKLLATAASPNDDLTRVSSPYGHSEIFFRFLARQCLELTDPTLALLVTDALTSLVQNTRKSPFISQLCIAMLHQTFPGAPTPNHFEISVGKFFRGLPLKSLSNAVVSPIKGHVCSLAKYRCTSMKWRHIAYLVVGSWAYSVSASAGSFLLTYYLGEMRALIDAAVSHDTERNKKNNAVNVNKSEDELSEGRNELAVVVDGEHIVLKSLTNESLPYFVEAVLLCAIASLYRATPKKTAQVLKESNPFIDYCKATDALKRTLQVFVRAETCGFNLPVKTNLLVLRGGTFAARSVKSILAKCMAWRNEQNVRDNSGALEHLSVLFEVAQALSMTMEMVTSTFQERVVLKMQHNGGSRRRGGWSNELLAKTYRKKYNTRRWISKSEAKLLPFFSYEIQELQDFLQDQSDVNNIVLESARAEWESTDNIWSDYEHCDVMLSDDKLVSACRTLQETEITATLLRDWRPSVSVDTDGDETDLDDEEVLADTKEVDEELLSEDDDDEFVVRSYGTMNRTTLSSGCKKAAVELQDNEDLGFPAIVVNFKKHKKTHKS
ncbi:unnamed protein product [Peronospora belbahrii]|uniref:Uncharacterized protein n=1 Tax=Peronospora belbahrii TaxID=622444 RepID=A0AAU9KV30_9STRA|nr:unnamed protein product [Peronospora belbahrii]CAH0513716.1 unnamed protein product [Peronospora belbahrii]